MEQILRRDAVGAETVNRDEAGQQGDGEADDGESLRAMEELVNEAGGIIVGKMAVLAEGDANDRPDITVLGKLPLFNPDGTQKA